MKSNLSLTAVMTISEGEEFFAGQTTPLIPQVGIYKLLAKKKLDATIEWAHFVEREDGQKGNVMRGTVNNSDEFALVIDTINNNLRRIFGITLQPAAYEVCTLDGKRLSDTVH
jgi:hypothetical protein